MVIQCESGAREMAAEGGSKVMIEQGLVEEGGG